VRVWFDTEFIDTGKEIHLLSIGLVRADGMTYYAEPDNAPKELACDWVMKNVMPYLSGITKPRDVIRDEIVSFCCFRPEFWTYYGAYDWVLLCQLFGRMLDVPDDWPNCPMDVQQWRVMAGIRQLPKHGGKLHNALDDAVWTKQAWEYLQSATQPINRET
jgi:hypothetical protein